MIDQRTAPWAALLADAACSRCDRRALSREERYVGKLPHYLSKMRKEHG